MRYVLLTLRALLALNYGLGGFNAQVTRYLRDPFPSTYEPVSLYRVVRRVVFILDISVLSTKYHQGGIICTTLSGIVRR
jgi:hypothetical protein